MIVKMIAWEIAMMKVLPSMTLFRNWKESKTAEINVNLYSIEEKRNQDVAMTMMIMMMIDIKILYAHNHTHFIHAIHVINPIMVFMEVIKAVESLPSLTFQHHQLTLALDLTHVKLNLAFSHHHVYVNPQLV